MLQGKNTMYFILRNLHSRWHIYVHIQKNTCTHDKGQDACVVCNPMTIYVKKWRILKGRKILAWDVINDIMLLKLIVTVLGMEIVFVDYQIKYLFTAFASTENPISIWH